MTNNKRIGSAGENLAAGALRRIGVEMVEEIATPVIVSRQANGRMIVVGYKEKVSGDHRGIYRGRSILAETKTVTDRNLQYGDLRPHQPERLEYHAECGGVSLLVWVHHSGVYIMQYPIEGFKKGKSLTPERARELNIENIADAKN
jgi:penicillin-binding protein-related factor A (putative recombinase)